MNQEAKNPNPNENQQQPSPSSPDAGAGGKQEEEKGIKMVVGNVPALTVQLLNAINNNLQVLIKLTAAQADKSVKKTRQ